LVAELGVGAGVGEPPGVDVGGTVAVGVAVGEALGPGAVGVAVAPTGRTRTIPIMPLVSPSAACRVQK
jgi:hypothetical protein